jgi:hypothetical protein
MAMRPILLGALGLASTGAAAMAGPAAGPVPLGDDELGRATGGAAAQFPFAALPTGLPPEATVAAQPYLDRANAIIAQANGLLVQRDALLATLGLGAVPSAAGADVVGANGANAGGGIGGAGAAAAP